MENGDHTAVSQSLGYLYQFERATYRLLQAPSNVVSVGVECVDDVSELRVDGSIVREQDKTTLSNRNPLSDRSVALWKTLAIWSRAVASNPACLDATEFHLVTNGTITETCLARCIHLAKDTDKQEDIAAQIRSRCDELRDDLSEFGVIVKKLPTNLLAKLIGQLFVFDSQTISASESLDAIPTLRYFGQPTRQAIFDSALGWVSRTIRMAASRGEPSEVDRTAFDREIRALVRRVQVAPIIAVTECIPTSSVDTDEYRQHGFFHQLEWVDVDPDYARECVIDYVKAKAARLRWTDTDVVSEASVAAYERDLKSRWRLNVQRQRLCKYESAEAQGLELLLESLSTDVPMDGQILPHSITCGNYHALADFASGASPELGWHPDYKNRAHMKVSAT